MPTPARSGNKTRFLPRLKINAASLAVLVLFSLFLAGIPLLMIQLQKSQLRQVAAQSRVDSVLWITYQFEREHSRLRMALRNAIDSPTPSAQQDLALRYDIFYSRFDLLKTSPSLEYLHSTKEYRAAREALDNFVKKADPMVGSLNTRAADTELLKELLLLSNTDEEALRDLTNFSTNTVSREIDARNATIKNQSWYIVVLAALQWLILSGALIGLVVYVRRQRLHNLELTKFTRRLHLASRRADSANRAKSLFLANMSHELRTPFQGLLGMLNLLSDTSLSRQQQDYTHTALSSSRHLLGILNDILDISTIESGTMKLRLAPVHLGQLIAQVQALMQVTARDKNIALTVVQDVQLPPWIEADATRLSQILFNLLSNAIKFSDAGLVELRLVLLHQAPSSDGQAMQIKVKDTGVGMDAPTLEGLFTRFHQADGSMQRRHGGTGLGLEITRNLVHMMQGYISVASTLGVGTEFTITLPLHVASAPDTPQLNPLTAQQHRSLHVLVADDHPVNTKYLTILLEKLGHSASSCDNGAQALAYVQNHACDVVLMDLHMPVMDGISATRAIRQLPGQAAHTKIIMVSADILSESRQSALEAGVEGFIAKPIMEDGLRKALGLLDGTAGIASLANDLSEKKPEDKPAAKDATGKTQTYVDAQIFRDFVDLMPPETVTRQLHALFSGDANDLQTIASALSQGDHRLAGHCAHQLKGVCMLMGLNALGQILTEIEKAANSGPTKPANLLTDLAQQLPHIAHATHAAVQSLR